MAKIFGILMKIDQFCENIFQTPVFKLKSSHFVNFNICLETMDSQVFRDVNILGFWRQIVKLMLGNFLGILDKNGQNFGIFMKNESIFYQKIRNVPIRHILYAWCAHILFCLDFFLFPKNIVPQLSLECFPIHFGQKLMILTKNQKCLRTHGTPLIRNFFLETVARKPVGVGHTSGHW